MADLLKIAAIMAVIVTLLRYKVPMAAVMPAGALLLGAIYLTPIPTLAAAAVHALIEPKSLEMTVTLILTMVMENILRTSGMLTRMVSSLSGVLSDRRIVMAAMPAMIGMLPSPGGAYFSAPMVAEAAGEVKIPAEQKALINYWYRHIWEYISPLYPGIILAAGITGISTRTFFLANLPFALSVVLWGALFCFSGIPPRMDSPATERRTRRKELLSFLLMVSPIALALLLTVAFSISPVISMGISIAALYAAHRYGPGAILANLKASVSPKALFLVLGIMVFKEVLGVTGALHGVSTSFAASGLPVWLLVALIPFVAGLVTGLTVGYVGITFPLLLPLMGAGTPSPGLASLAFAAGFTGVMLSPVHLCYVLTCEYFHADVARVYRRLLLPSALVLAAAVLPLILF